MVVGLQQTNAGSLAVVLKPDGNTEISLHLKLQHGHFEAFAVLERGDFKALTSEWAQLQSRLADQGIRLAPLVSNLPHTTGFAGGQFSSPKQQRDDTPSTADFPGPNIASIIRRASPTRQLCIPPPDESGGLNPVQRLCPSHQLPQQVQQPPPRTSTARRKRSSSQLPQQTLGQADFLTLLVAQLSSQDPMNPVSNTDFAAQMAQFSTLQTTQTMQTNMAAVQAGVAVLAATPTSLLGKTVNLQTADGQTVTGVVSSVQYQSGTPTIMVNGQAYSLTQVTSISQTQTPVQLNSQHLCSDHSIPPLADSKRSSNKLTSLATTSPM